MAHEVVEKRTGKVDWSHITTEALKFQAKEYVFHLVGHRAPPQVTGLACALGRKLFGSQTRDELEVPLVKLLENGAGLHEDVILQNWKTGRYSFKIPMCYSAFILRRDTKMNKDTD